MAGAGAAAAARTSGAAPPHDRPCRRTMQNPAEQRVPIPVSKPKRHFCRADSALQGERHNSASIDSTRGRCHSRHCGAAPSGATALKVSCACPVAESVLVLTTQTDASEQRAQSGEEPQFSRCWARLARVSFASSVRHEPSHGSRSQRFSDNTSAAAAAATAARTNGPGRRMRACRSQDIFGPSALKFASFRANLVKWQRAQRRKCHQEQTHLPSRRIGKRRWSQTLFAFLDWPCLEGCSRAVHYASLGFRA